MASRPKKGTAMPVVSFFLVHQHRKMAAASKVAQQFAPAGATFGRPCDVGVASGAILEPPRIFGARYRLKPATLHHPMDHGGPNSSWRSDHHKKNRRLVAMQ